MMNRTIRKSRSSIGNSPLRPLSPLLPLHPAFLLLCLLFSVLLSAQDTGTARDAWQRPAEVMDALGISSGSVVADIGAGNGYFTFHLAERVGRSGRVYAVEIDEAALEKVKLRARKERLSQIEGVRGSSADPRLAAESLDAALIVNAYHEMRDYDAMLAALHRALKPGGRLGIIDAAIEAGENRETYFGRHRVPAELVREDAERAGFRFLGRRPGFTRPRDDREFYFLLFDHPVSEGPVAQDGPTLRGLPAAFHSADSLQESASRSRRKAKNRCKRAADSSARIPAATSTR